MFNIQLYSKANPLTEIKVKGNYFDEQMQCSPKIYIKNTLTNQQYILSLPLGGAYPLSVFLEKGSYKAWFELESFSTNNCAQSEPATISLNWNDESSYVTKVIGGLRIQSITDYTVTDSVANKRNFEYLGDNGFTSGRLVNIPTYYGLVYSLYNSSIPIGYQKYVNAITPLATTQGSNVGYGKVTVSHENKINGKEETYYTTAADFPNSYDAIDPSTGLERVNIFDGVRIYAYPRAEEDSKDFLRGVVKKEITYKKEGAVYNKIVEKLYSYDSLKYALGDFVTFDDYVKNAAKTVRGLKIYNSSFTYYDIYTGYNLPSKVIEKYYNDSEVLTTTTTQTYDKNADNIVQHYFPIRSKSIDSQGSIFSTENAFVFNKTSKTSAEQDLFDNQNAFYLPIESKSYKNNILLGTQHTVYKNDWQNSPGLNVPNKIQILKGIPSLTNPLEDRIIYHSYDNKGNPLEVSKKDGTKMYYVWGYQQSQPIAKITGYTDAALASAQSLITAAIAASNNDNDRKIDIVNINGSITKVGKEGDLREALRNLRTALPNAQVTTFTYDPLIGVTSTTDPRGQTVYYQYDAFNRLESVKDSEGNMVSKNEYNYKN